MYVHFSKSIVGKFACSMETFSMTAILDYIKGSTKQTIHFEILYFSEFYNKMAEIFRLALFYVVVNMFDSLDSSY